MLAPSDSVLFAIGIVNVDDDCLCLATTASNPMGDIIVRQKRSALEEVMIWNQGCENAIQQCSSNALVIELRVDHKLKLDGAVVRRVFVSQVGSDGEADNIFLLLSNYIFLATARLLSHVDSDNERISLIFSLL